jgi:hypothetical protein
MLPAYCLIKETHGGLPARGLSYHLLNCSLISSMPDELNNR